MKKISKKLMLSIVAIALVVIALGTSTFAWFTLSNKASVGQFDVQVTAGEGMELSIDNGATWYSAIPSDVMQAKIKANFLEVIEDVKPAGKVVGNNPVLSAVSTPTLTDTDLFQKLDIANKKFVPAMANVDFIKVNVMVRAVSLNKVSVSAISLVGPDTDWKADATFTHANGSAIIKNTVYKMSAASGARVAIKEIGVESSFVYQNEAKGGNSIPTSSSTNTIGAVAPALTVTDSSDPVAYKAALLEEANPGQEKYFVEKTGLDMRGFTDYPEDAVLAASGAVGADVLTLLPGDTYNVSAFHLYVWFEGFDFDTYNAILKMPLSVSLSLEGRKV